LFRLLRDGRQCSAGTAVAPTSSVGAPPRHQRSAGRLWSATVAALPLARRLVALAAVSGQVCLPGGAVFGARALQCLRWTTLRRACRRVGTVAAPTI